MLETALIFAAGFLTASMLALLILPSVNTRATRLARRRLAAQFPISIEELTAQMDYIRAEGAVEIRKVERQLEKEREAHALNRSNYGSIEAVARKKAITDEAQLKALSEENALLKAELTKVSEDRDIKQINLASLETQLACYSSNQIALHAQEESELLETDQLKKIKQENAWLRERIEAVAADIIALATDKPTANKGHATAA